MIQLNVPGEIRRLKALPVLDFGFWILDRSSSLVAAAAARSRGLLSRVASNYGLKAFVNGAGTACPHYPEYLMPGTSCPRPGKSSLLQPWLLSKALALTLLVGGLSKAFADEVPKDDVVFKALSDELKRSMTLRLEDLDTPYFVQYAVDDTVSHRVSATYGAIVSSTRSRSRILHSQLRVGSYELDNSNFAGGRGGGGRAGLSISAELPIDDGYMALRQAIWRATDWQYKSAVETLTQKRAYLKDRTVADRPRDFNKAGAVIVIKDPAVVSFDRNAWEEHARRISARFGEYRHIQDSGVSLATSAENRYLVNSENSRVRHGKTEAVLRISAEALAEDGERLADSLAYYAPTLEQLPPVTEVLADVGKLADRLAAAIRAPILEDYTGPVLIEGVAAAQFFRQLLARGIAGQVDPVGAPRRGAQGTDDLESRLGKRILPPTFQIFDDPRPAKFQGEFLAGHYELDDEGTAAQRVSIVVDGKLEGMVTSRMPTKQIAQSNGHGRRVGGGTPSSSIGCLYVESTKSESPEDLKKELLDAADSEGLKFGLRITSLQNRAGGGPGGFGGFGGRFGRGGGGGGATRVVGDPISIFRVYVADGREEPVRGCEFSSVDIRSLRRIIAAGNTPVVHNSTGGAPPSSVIAPAILVEELELARIRTEPQKKPIVEAPHARRISER